MSENSQSYNSYCEKQSCLNDVYVRGDEPPARGTGQDERLDNGQQGQGHLGGWRGWRRWFYLYLLKLNLELNLGQFLDKRLVLFWEFILDEHSVNNFILLFNRPGVAGAVL